MQKLLKSLILLNLLLLAGPWSHAATLGLDDSQEPVFKLRNDAGTNINDLFYNLGGDGSTPEAAITLYVPLSTGVQNTAYYLDSPDLADGSSEDGGIYFLDIDSKGHSNEELYVAVKDNDNGSDAEYRFVKRIADSDLEQPFVDFFSLCTTSELNCAAISDSIASIKDSVELVFFFKPNGTDYDSSSNIEIPETLGQAIYFKLVLSAAASNIQDNASLTVDSTYAGDSTAILEYSGDHGGNGSYISRMALYYVNPDPGAGNIDKTHFKEILEGQNEDGNAKITRLTNNVTYRAGILYLDHFGFSGPKPSPDPTVESESFQPKPIEKLLAKNQCYFVTAGFGHDHYVLDYFRYIRDTYLMNSWAGRLLVEFYYGSAPSFVKYILNNKALAFTIKIYSFSIYFILQNLVFVIGCITLLSTFTFRREIKKCLIKY